MSDATSPVLKPRSIVQNGSPMHVTCGPGGPGGGPGGAVPLGHAVDPQLQPGARGGGPGRRRGPGRCGPRPLAARWTLEDPHS